GADQMITQQENSVTLDGSASTDADGEIIAYEWMQVSGPSMATLTNANSAVVTVSDLTLGTYTFQLTVTDDSSATDNDYVNVYVQQEITVDFHLLTPTDKSMVTNTRRPVFTWEPMGGATKYEIYVNVTRDDYDWYASGNLLDRYTKVGESNGTNFTMPYDLVDRWTYKWYVVAKTAAGDKNSNIQQFGLYLPYMEQANDGVNIVNGCRDMNKNGTIEPFEDWHLTPEERLNDLMPRLTLEEKCSQLFYAGDNNPLDGFAFSYGVEGGMTTTQQNAARTRMGIPVAFMGDKVHGWKTIFPTQLGMAAIRDMDMVYRAGNLQRLEHKNFGFTGTLAPLAEVDTKVLYPRFQEGCGENADEAAAHVRAIVCGMQGGPELNPHSMLITVKHWPGQGAGGESELQYDAVTIKYHMKPWHAAFEANAASVMPGYNRAPYIDPDFGANSSKKVIDYLRKEMNFQGFVVTDWLGSNTGQSIESLGAGVDVMGGAPSRDTDFNQLQAALGIDRINEACRRVLNAKIRLGMFENPYGDPTATYSKAEHHEFVVDAARKSFTLIKNNGVLPFNGPDAGNIKLNNGNTIVVGGPRAVWDNQNVDPNVIWQSIYYDDPKAFTYYQAIQNRVAGTGINVALNNAGNAKVAVVVIGEVGYTHGPVDKSPEIPADQIAVIQNFKNQGIPVVCAIVMARPYVLTPIEPLCDAIVILYRGGTGAGEAFAQLLFGDYQPSGKLPFQLPRSVDQIGTDVVNDQKERWELPYDLGATDAERAEIRNYIANDLPVPFNFGDPLYPYGYGFNGYKFEDATPPTAFNLISPENNANVQLGEITLKWEPSSDPETNLHHYEVWLDGAKYAEVKGTMYTLPSNIQEGRHTWNVVAVNWAQGRRTSTQTNAFNMADTQGPAPFDILSPADGMSVTAGTIPLTWESTTDAGKGMDHYALYIDNAFVRNYQPNEVQEATNIAIGKTVTVSSTQNGTMPGSNAVDGADNTRWSSNATDNEYITIDLGSVQKVTRVELVWETACGKEYLIQFSFDGNTWRDVVTETAGKPGEFIYDDINQKARFVRMQGQSRGTQYGYSLYEFRVFGTSVMQYNANGLALGEHTWYVRAYDKNNNITDSNGAPSHFTVYQQGTNLPPYAYAGEDQDLLYPNTSTVLDGAQSYDPEGRAVTFSWRQVEGPNNATFSSRNVAQPQISGLVVGTYVFELTVNDGAKTSTSEVTVVVRFKTLVDDYAIEGVSIYPNPVHGILTIEGPTDFEMIDLTIINVAGDIMYRQDYAGDHQTKIDCSAYANGVYFLKINHKEGVMIHKIIKK
ncbi:MAG: glycoside hydrolase family 3 C-terminal domain-containing protein, partial [Paludibacteraceae bacterium]|nr:glycoside hydrolase family 3 C-terminal domain-containing protein [Paludibacteraceae bacterium]